MSRRIKIEVNTREHFTVLGLVEVPFRVESPWFSGAASVSTYPVAELLGTKLRALYQRRKGRDLFDLWDALGRAEVDPEVVVRCFREYLARQGLSISKADFEANLLEKLGDPTFEADARPLLRDGTGYELAAAVALVRERLVGLL